MSQEVLDSDFAIVLVTVYEFIEEWFVKNSTWTEYLVFDIESQ